MIPTLGIIYLIVVGVVASGVIYVIFAEVYKSGIKINLLKNKGEDSGREKKKKKTVTSKT